MEAVAAGPFCEQPLQFVKRGRRPGDRDEGPREQQLARAAGGRIIRAQRALQRGRDCVALRIVQVAAERRLRAREQPRERDLIACLCNPGDGIGQEARWRELGFAHGFPDCLHQLRLEQGGLEVRGEHRLDALCVKQETP
jgi:hypothetical protein